jgi:hypothetical protein
MGKQTVSALGTLVVLAAAFLGYEQTLGRLTDFDAIDPSMLEPLADTDGPTLPPTEPEDQIAARRAFGPEEAAKLSRLKMYQVPKSVFSNAPAGRGLGLFIFFGNYDMTKHKDPKLVEFSPITVIYISGKPEGDGSQDDIYSLKADQALIRFDRDVVFTQAANAQPVAGWVQGKVQLRSNQGSPRLEDDVTMRTERLDYERAKNLIWSDEFVEVTDVEGMKVTGKNLEIALVPEGVKPRPGEKKKKSVDVEQLKLLDDVKFHLLVDADGDLFGGMGGSAVANSPKPAAVKAKTKTPLDVSAKGPFIYDVREMKASFDRSVEVERTLAGPTVFRDRLICERLLLQFAEKSVDKSKPPSAPAADASVAAAQQKTELASVEAFGANDTLVVIAESQKLRATGDHLFHDAAKKQTRMTSAKQLVVFQDNVRIQGRSLLVLQDLKNSGGTNDVREAVIEGPNGLFEVMDKENPGPVQAKDLVVRFNKSLRVTPEGAKSKMVVVDGGVELEAPKQPLLMKSETMRVRLEEVADADKGDGKANAKLEPTWLQAQRSVTVTSPELDVDAGQSLTMHVVANENEIRAAPGNAKLVPEDIVRPVNFVALPDPQDLQPAAKAFVDPTARPAKVGAGEPKKKGGGFALGLGKGKERDPKKPPDKVDLRAETVEVFAVKVDGKTEARRAEAVGNVFIRRDSAAKLPEDAVEIKGDRADFYRSEKGDRMIVRSAKNAAEIVNKKFHLEESAHIDLDEGANLMSVPGPGKLTLAGTGLVNTTDAPKQNRSSDQPFVVSWKEKMLFDGRNAHFDGDVVSAQISQRHEPIEELVDQRINCRHLTVVFKDSLSFKSAKAPNGRKMEVFKVVCDRDVVVQEMIYHNPRGKDATLQDLFRYSRIRASSLRLDNERRDVVASGPDGEAVFVERAKPGEGPDGKQQTPSLPYVRTKADFGQMTYLQSQNVVNLMDDVRILRSPVKDVRVVPSMDKLHPEAVAVNGQQVQLFERVDVEGRKQHDFKARQEVVIHSKEYEGFGDEVTYDQTRDRMVLKGGNAVLSKKGRPGLESNKFEAEEIEYYVKDNRVVVKGGQRAPNLDLGGFKGKNALPVKAPKRKE